MELLLGVQQNINWLVRVSAAYIAADVIRQHLSRIHAAFAWRQHLPQSRPDLGRSATCRRRPKLGPVGSGAFFLTVGQRWSDIRKGSGNDAPQWCRMITGLQIKTARVLLGWSVPDLARRTGIDIANIQELESAAKVPNRRRNDLELIQAILEEAGINLLTRSEFSFARLTSTTSPKHVRQERFVNFGALRCAPPGHHLDGYIVDGT